MDASPSPKTQARSRWRSRLVLSGGLMLVAASGGLSFAALSLPGWIEQRLRAALAERLQADVAIEAVDVDFEALQVSGLAIRRPDVELVLPRVDVSWTWTWTETPMMVAPRVVVSAGTLDGTILSVRAWADDVIAQASARVAPSGGEGERAWSLRSAVDLANVGFEVDPLQIELDGRGTPGEAKISATAVARGTREAVELEARSLRIQISGRRPLYARAISTQVEISEQGLTLPMTARVEGGAAGITDQIFAVDVHGEVSVADAEGRKIALDLRGGLEPSRAAGDDLQDEEAAPVPAESPLWTLKAEGARDLSEGVVDLELANFELGRAPQLLRRLPLVDSKSATVGGNLHFERSGGDIETKGNLVLDGLNIDHPLLARTAVENVGFRAALEASVDPSRDAATIRSLRISREAVGLELEGEVRWPEELEGRAVSLSVSMPPTPCQAVLRSIPPQLVPGLRDLEVAGDMSVDLRAEVDMADLDALELSGSVNVRKCTATRIPREVRRLGAGFVHRVMMKNGRTRGIDLTERSMGWTLLGEIAPSMVGAVLTTEDAGFFRHRGFLGSQFKTALQRNLRDRRFRLGASTITMQLAKNLLLSHEKTLSRKLQEMVLTWLLERTYSKQRLMELYLNVVEFGPQIYGVTAAAEHYFGKIPKELTSLESAWLALLLPSPVVRYAHFCEGKPSPAFEVKLRRIHRLMRSRGHIDELEYALWSEAPLVFAEHGRSDRVACVQRRAAMLAGRSTQYAVSGVLGSPRRAGRTDGGTRELPGSAGDEQADGEGAAEAEARARRPAMDVAWEEAE